MEYKNQDKSSLKWFDRSHIKNVEKLSKDEIKWLTNYSVSFFTPFSFILRGQFHFDLLLVWIFYAFLYSFSSIKLLPSYLSSPSQIVMWLVIIILTIFSLKHLRRLEWNRGFYKTIEEYKKSETKWNNWGIFFIIFIIFSQVGQFLK